VRFLADESCDFRVVIALRQAGHDVTATADIARGAADRDVLDTCRREQRILITEDRDFGQLVFASGATAGGGVLYVRCPEVARPALAEAITALVGRLGDQLERSFVVWSPRRVRVRSLGAG
jgi:predicted nuclease of predicted toxin-antitoxin system